jgi:hypothetical protein
MSEPWSKPTRAEVERVLASIADISLRSLFFSELENPEWLDPLAELGVFSNPPEPQIDAEGVERVLPWSEGDFLVRIAADRPEKVAVTLKEVADSRNPWVQRALVSAARKLPSEYAKQLVQPIAKIVRSSTGWLNVQEVMGVVVALADANEMASAKTLLRAMFEPLPGSEEEMAIGARTRIRGAIDDYVYTQLLPKTRDILARLDNIDGLKMVAGWLQRASKIQSGASQERHDYDASSIWRPSIAPHAQNSGLPELTDSLIDAVRDTAIDLGRRGHAMDVIDFLNASRPFVLRRIAAEVVAQLLVDDDPSPDAVAAAQRMLVDPTLMGIGSRPEYVHLARAILPRLDDAGRRSWAEFVLSCDWQGTDDDMRRIAAWGSSEPEDVTDAEVNETRQHLLHRFLQPLAGGLPSPLASELAALEAKWGRIEHAEFGSYLESFTGPTSPKTRAQLLEMTSDELAEYLARWEPVRDHHFGPSVEGLARELESVVEAKPELVAGIADRLIGLGRSYARAAVAGWAKAVANGFEPSELVWRMVGDLVREPDDGSDELTELDFGAGDPVWRSAQRSAVDLIAACVEAMPLPAPATTVTQLWGLLKPLTSHADPTVAHEERYGGSNMDPLTLSLNTTRPSALRAAIRLASASHADRAPGDLNATEVDILQTIATHVDNFEDPSLAVAAVIGEGLGRLWGTDPTWVHDRRSDLFSVLDSDEARRARADVIVSVALGVYQTGRVFLTLIRPAIAEILSKRYSELEHTEGWRHDRSAASAAALHMVSAYLLQVVDRDDAELQRVFSGAVPVDIASDVIGHIGWQIMRMGMDGDIRSIPEDYLGRAKELIGWRVEEIRAKRASAKELAQFHWWAQSGAFEPSWWLPILQLATEEADADSRGMLGEALADAAASEPALAIEVFEALYGGPDRDWRSYDLVRHAPSLLATALRSNDGAAVSGANRIKDLLGRQGHFATLQELEQLLLATDSQHGS